MLNTSVIVGENFLLGLNPQDINTLMVYKGTDAPAQWRSLVGNGILDIILKGSGSLGLEAKRLLSWGAG